MISIQIYYHLRLSLYFILQHVLINFLPFSFVSLQPLIIGTNNGIGCCYTTSNRRIQNGNIHCELDVESADSGRGASEDDPSQLGGQFMHFYPTCHVSNFQHGTTIAHINNSSSVHVNGTTTLTCVQNMKLEDHSTNNSSSIVLLPGGMMNNNNNCSSVGDEQSKSNWNTTAVVRRLKL
ncbi:unnamed protein product [Schistosoma mansoni]|uniref:Smp_205920 n=1 Tax=Schistosoma mansoni TaxID=6183 RepID=UPI00022C86A3|nr:unnamed protein product [Schistosoma mansoni]|eukprot:XP_018644791.1 unnamed protein product [Schistosoma mansoni]